MVPLLGPSVEGASAEGSCIVGARSASGSGTRRRRRRHLWQKVGAGVADSCIVPRRRWVPWSRGAYFRSKLGDAARKMPQPNSPRACRFRNSRGTILAENRRGIFAIILVRLFSLFLHIQFVSITFKAFRYSYVTLYSGMGPHLRSRMADVYRCLAMHNAHNPQT